MRSLPRRPRAPPRRRAVIATIFFQHFVHSVLVDRLARLRFENRLWALGDDARVRGLDAAALQSHRRRSDLFPLSATEDGRRPVGGVRPSARIPLRVTLDALEEFAHRRFVGWPPPIFSSFAAMSTWATPASLRPQAFACIRGLRRPCFPPFQRRARSPPSIADSGFLRLWKLKTPVSSHGLLSLRAMI